MPKQNKHYNQLYVLQKKIKNKDLTNNNYNIIKSSYDFFSILFRLQNNYNKKYAIINKELD